MIEVFYKHILFGEEFEHKGITYKKTNLMRGIYIDDNGKTVHRRFKKKTVVKADEKQFDISPTIN